MCEHLQPIEQYIKSKEVAETFRGQAWSNNCREWVYFDCVLDAESLKEKINAPACIIVHEYLDNRAGNEKGLICDCCQDGIMGYHPDSAVAKTKPVIQ